MIRNPLKLIFIIIVVSIIFLLYGDNLESPLATFLEWISKF